MTLRHRLWRWFLRWVTKDSEAVKLARAARQHESDAERRGNVGMFKR